MATNMLTLRCKMAKQKYLTFVHLCLALTRGVRMRDVIWEVTEATDTESFLFYGLPPDDLCRALLGTPVPS